MHGIVATSQHIADVATDDPISEDGAEVSVPKECTGKVKILSPLRVELGR